MPSAKQKADQELLELELRLTKEITLWEKIVKIFPISILMIISVLYFGSWDSMIGIVLKTAIIVFFLMCFFWWLWALHKIVAIAKYLISVQNEFSQLTVQLIKMRSKLNNNQSTKKSDKY